MGIRFRKSIRLGKGIRINLSGSGVGYSVGWKGFRFTKPSKGRSRTTTSIPGTGLSFTNSLGTSSKRQNRSGTSKYKGHSSGAEKYQQYNMRKKDPTMAWIDFAICFLFGFLGVHKFREKRVGMGLLYLFTGGLFLIGWLVDCIKYLILAIDSQKQETAYYYAPVDQQQNMPEGMFPKGNYMEQHMSAPQDSYAGPINGENWTYTQQTHGQVSQTNAYSSANYAYPPQIPKKPNKVKSILLWVVSGFFALMFLVYIPSIASFVSLVVAILTAPIPVIQKFIGKYIKGTIKTVVIIVMALLAFMIAPTSETVETENANADSMVMMTESTDMDEETKAPTDEETMSTAAQSENDEGMTEPSEEVEDADAVPSEEDMTEATEPESEPTTEPTEEPTTEVTTEPTTEPTTEATTEPTTEPPEEYDYVLNTSTRKFHETWCNSVDDIKSYNRKDYHGTRESVISMGYSPCGRCKP